MKKKMLIVGAAGMVLLGGALGVGAFTETGSGKSTDRKDIISMEEAKEIALKEVDGTVESIELETDDGMLKYEIDIREAGGHDDDTDVKVDALTGKVLKVDRDDDGDDDDIRFDDDRDGTKADIHKAKISLEEAVNIALKDSPGTVTEAESDDGHYEIEIKDGSREIEIKVDSRTGAIIEKEIDDED